MSVALSGNGAAMIGPQSTSSSSSTGGRGLPNNPAQGIRRYPPLVNTLPPMPPPPIPDKYHANQNSSSSNLVLSPTQTPPMSANQVISLAKDAMASALHDNESQVAEASAVSTDLKPGVTIDLSRKNIQELPDEVVDIIKHELERLALSHNKLASFPARFSECVSLRYLNVRNNLIKDFPLPLCDLKSLEILDLGRNKIRVLPADIAKLSSLKVLAVQKNRIEELPPCLAEMGSLQVLKLDGNNITFPPKEVLQVQAQSPPHDGWLKETEVNEVALTAHIKKFLKNWALSANGRDKDSENGGDELSEGTETPRVPLKRVASGRFPVRVNGSDVSDMRSPANSRAPLVPSRSHARGLSQTNTAFRRPSVMPLTIGNPNERLRSNSETLYQPPKAERPPERHRRMGIVSKRANELGTLDETQANNRFSHYRGMSETSSMTGNVNPNAAASISPNSPAEPLLQRPNYVRRLSVLPEQRRESKAVDPIVESAKGILYSIFQIHPMIQLFTRLTGDGTAKRSSLEIVFYNTNVHVEELEQEIQKHDFALEKGGLAPRENGNIQRAVLTLINAYSHICSLLAANMDSIVRNGDPRYIRSMLMLLYNSIMELRVTANEASMGTAGYAPSHGLRRPGIGDTIKPHSRDSSIDKVHSRERSLEKLHSRERSVEKLHSRERSLEKNHSRKQSREKPHSRENSRENSFMAPMASRAGLTVRPRPGGFVHNPSNLRVATDVSVPYSNGVERTPQLTSATPRSGESFASISTDGRYATDLTEEERQFDRIFLSLQKSADLVMRTLPNFNKHFNLGRRNAEATRAPEHIVYCWRSLVAKCTHTLRETEILKNHLSHVKLKDPGVRSDPEFWSVCKIFIDAWVEYGNNLRGSMEHISLPADFKSRLRPIQISVKETNQLISESHWAHLFRQTGSFTPVPSHFSPTHYPTNSVGSQLQMSAALGPAVQATVPSTPQSASFTGSSFAKAFSGNVFERADALLSTMGGISRTGTMNSTSTASLNSMSSMTSAQDDRQGPSSSLSPNGYSGPFRFNGGGRQGF